MCASGFKAGFVLSFRWIPSELNIPTRELAFDCDHDPSESLLHVPAQRLRSSSSPTRDQNCFSTSLMNLNIGKADLTFHTHVPAMSVQSCHNRMIFQFARDMLRLSHHQTIFHFVEEVIAQRCEFQGPVTFRGLPFSLFRCQFLGESQVRWSPSGSGAKAHRTQSLVNINENCPNSLIPDNLSDINGRRE